MKFMGLDYGSRRIGVAISNTDGTIAFPRVTLDNDASLFERLEKLVEEEKVARIIMGDTRSYGGAANQITGDAEEFAKKLGTLVSVPVESFFEVATTVEARQFAPEAHSHDDAAAAAVILQRYLDMKGGRVE